MPVLRQDDEVKLIAMAMGGAGAVELPHCSHTIAVVVIDLRRPVPIFTLASARLCPGQHNRFLRIII
jgi:hypothetical protein